MEAKNNGNRRYIFVYLGILIAGTPFLVKGVPLSSCFDHLSTLRAAEPNTPHTVALWIHRQHPNLHQSPSVQDISDILKLQKPGEKLAAWADLFKQVSEDPALKEKLRQELIRQNVIKEEEIPESFYQRQQALAREAGHGDIPLNDQARQEIAKVIIEDQQTSLAHWFDYLTSPDTSHYPAWAKAYVLTQITKISKLDQAARGFPKRKKGQVAPFPELNREALAKVMQDLIQRATGGSRETFSFKNAYAREFLRLQEKKGDPTVTEGKWVKFPQGSDPAKLTTALSGCNTGWCTADIGTATNQLKAGDFHIYFSNDKDGKPTVPRIAIRMENGRISEVRGTTPGQNLDSHIAGTRILKDKLFEFGKEGTLYQKRSEHMRTLTTIERKHKSNRPLTHQETRFLYELDEPIVGFGYHKDPRIEEILKQRDARSDISIATGIPKEDISVTTKDALKGSRLHLGNLKLDDVTFPKGAKLPETIHGALSLPNLANANGLKFPEEIRGSLDLSSLKSVNGVQLPNTVHGSLYLPNLRSAENLILPKILYGDLNMTFLTSTKNVKFPQKMFGDLSLDMLVSAKGFTLPEVMYGDLSMTRLPSAEGLTFPKTVHGTLNLTGLTSARGLRLPETIHQRLLLVRLPSTEGLKLPHTVKGELNLDSLKSAIGLNLPLELHGGLSLARLQSANGLVLPERMYGDLNLSGLTSGKGLRLPKTLYGELSLDSLNSGTGVIFPSTLHGRLILSLNSAEGLILPQKLYGQLFLDKLTSAKHLVLPSILEGGLSLNGLTSASGLKLPEHFNGDLRLNKLTSAKDLKLPRTVTGALDLRSLVSPEHLKLPHTVDGKLLLWGLTSVENLKLPKMLGGDIYLNKKFDKKSVRLPKGYSGKIVPR